MARTALPAIDTDGSLLGRGLLPQGFVQLVADLPKRSGQRSAKRSGCLPRAGPHLGVARRDVQRREELLSRLPDLPQGAVDLRRLGVGIRVLVMAGRLPPPPPHFSPATGPT